MDWNGLKAKQNPCAKRVIQLFKSDENSGSPMKVNLWWHLYKPLYETFGKGTGCYIVLFY